MATTVAAGTLALTGLGIVGAAAANAAVVNTSCDNNFYQASLGGVQCFVWTGSGTRTIEVDGPGWVCAHSGASVTVYWQGGGSAWLPNGACGSGPVYEFTINP